MFNYHELDIIKSALEASNDQDSDIYKKVSSLQDTMWFPGHILPPMYAKFYIVKGEESYFARRTDLAESYSPKNIKLQVNIEGEEWEEQTLNVGDFKWRYL